VPGEELRKPTIHDVLDLINDYRIGGLEQVLIGLDVVSAKNARAEEVLYARRHARADLRERYGDRLSDEELNALAERIEEEIRTRRPDV
jgi:uncharacterized protein YecE (DUF72 family)